ncbi:MAG: hypothetical protein K5753_05605 [Clostridia bacterium]|nr:hypothetical protein [Clostridia bacterium]
MKFDPVRFLSYEIRVPTFFDSDADGVGDLLGVKEKLPELVSLGINAIVLTSVFETSNVNSFYEVTDFCRINPQIGELSDFSELLNEARENGIAVYLSIPLFCTSAEHSWFEKRKNPKYASYYVSAPGKGKDGSVAPFRSKNRLGEEAWEEKDSGVFYKNTYGASSLDLDLENPELRNEMLSIVSFWKELGVAGFVIESLPFTIEKNAVKSGKLLYKPSPDLFAVGKDRFALLSEIRSRFGEDFHLLLRNLPQDEVVSLYLTDGNLPTIDALTFSNLDENTRLPSLKELNVRKWIKTYASIQSSPVARKTLLSVEDATHGRMLSSWKQCKDDQAYFYAAKSVALLLGASVGGVSLYQGQEIAMSDVVFRNSVTPIEENRQPSEKKYIPLASDPYQWDHKKHAGFTSALFPFAPVRDNYVKINRRMQEEDPESVLNFYKKVLDFRKKSDVFSFGDFVFYPSAHPLIVCFTRSFQEKTLLVIASLSPENVNFAIPRALTDRKGRFVFGNYSIVSRLLHETVGLRPFEARVYSIEPEVKLLSESNLGSRLEDQADQKSE